VKVTAFPEVGEAGDQLKEVTTRSGFAVPPLTVRLEERLLLVSLPSAMRFWSSTVAETVWVPAVAVQAAPAVPPLAVRLIEAPAARL